MESEYNLDAAMYEVMFRCYVHGIWHERNMRNFQSQRTIDFVIKDKIVSLVRFEQITIPQD